MSEQPKPTRSLMYLGTEVAYGKGNIPKATNSRWLDLGGIENDGRSIEEVLDCAALQKRECLYPVKMARLRGEPGAIWVFEAKEEGSSTIYPGTGHTPGRWKNDTDVTTWQVKEQALRKELMIAGRAAQEIEEKLPMETLKPFRRAYWSLNTRQRGIMLAQVMAYITGGNLKGND